ncbi:MAG: c-type cytochrome, partial [Planctomycetota bacterium]
EHRKPNMALLKKVFQAKEPRVRAAAIRTLGHWAEKADDWESTLLAAAQDESALVRAEAAKAAVEFAGLAAAEAVFEVSNRDTDPELNDVLTFARRRIDVDAMIADAIEKNQKLSPAARKYALQRADAALLLKMEKSPEVYEVLLSRANVKSKDRWNAVEALAQSRGVSKSKQLLASITSAERNQADSLSDLAGMLGTIKPTELSGLRNDLRGLVDQSKSSDTRIPGYAAWFDSGDINNAWKHALSSRERLGDALDSVSRIRDKVTQQMVLSRVRPLMFELPPSLKSKDDEAVGRTGPAVAYEYYEPNPGKNVAMETLDAAKPKSTGVVNGFVTFAPDGRKDSFAIRQTAAIKVPASGRYTFYTRSDDGSRLYIDGKQIVNNDGDHGQIEKSGRIRLDEGFHTIVVTYYDQGGADGLTVSWKGPGIKKQRIPDSALVSPGSGNLRGRALRVMASHSNEVKEKINDFTKLVDDKSLSSSALSALAGLPTRKVADQLSTDQSGSILKKIFEQADEASPVERQSNGFANLLALGNSLLVRSDSDAARRKLSELKASIPVKADPKIMALGKEVYSRESHCATCHQPHGRGLPNLYPPIDGSIWATGSEDRLIRMVLDGMHGTIEVNGKTYSSPPLPPMTGFRHLLNDEEIAAVLTYVRNSWSNRARPVEVEKVAKVRGIDRGKDAAFWSATDLLAQFPLEDGSSNVAQQSKGGWVPKFVKEWKAADFESKPISIKDRTHAKGKLAFERAGCAQCHKLDNVGGLFGPNLAELDIKKKNTQYVLESILNPSKDIEPKYAMKTYFLESGKIVSGMIVKETDKEVHLMADPLNQDKPVVVKKSNIEEETKTASSVMPQGLLNWLTHEEISELMAFVLAGGDSGSPLYK